MPKTDWRVLLAVGAALAVLVVASAAVIPGHLHSGMQGQSCNLCRNGYLPAPALLAPFEVHSPAPVEWSAHAADTGAAFEPALASHSPRAPPA